MALSLEELREEALALPSEQRLTLADSLYMSLEGPDQNFELHPAWIPELARRSDELRSGNVKGIPWEEVKAEMDSWK